MARVTDWEIYCLIRQLNKDNRAAVIVIIKALLKNQPSTAASS